ncbi:hypothetical protein FA09DRAFT_203845 [Tilletiopsis washingtonensis]|uniref:Uncharacterized protein n=1 Tax=Tilletiopsis washingtonensis TaxID=58919 RepID=A0A316ZEU6_9BASI|nr:hypothetical protein FA09DRAFT_203845 [Tilletiopsis washingtonensis]PWO00052.1 hypothetical protein FA09DRAFT_203845 [Tilletiopsis washingtonensis]
MRASSQSRRRVAESVRAPTSAARWVCGELEEARDAETDRTIEGCAFPSCVRCLLDACHAGGDCVAADEVRISSCASPWMRVRCEAERPVRPRHRGRRRRGGPSAPGVARCGGLLAADSLRPPTCSCSGLLSCADVLMCEEVQAGRTCVALGRTWEGGVGRLPLQSGRRAAQGQHVADGGCQRRLDGHAQAQRGHKSSAIPSPDDYCTTLDALYGM